MLPSTDNEQLKFTIVIDAQDSLEKAKLMQERIDAIREEMVDLQNQSNMTFRQIAMGMRAAADEALRAKEVNKEAFMTKDPTDPSKMILTPKNKTAMAAAEAEYEAAKQQVAEYKQFVAAATREIAKMQADARKAEATAAKQAAQEQRDLAKQSADQQKEMNQLVAQLRKDATQKEIEEQKRIAQMRQKMRQEDAEAAKQAAIQQRETDKQVTQWRKQIAKEDTEAAKQLAKEQAAATKNRLMLDKEANQQVNQSIREQQALEIESVRTVEKARIQARLDQAQGDKQRFNIAKEEATAAKMTEIAAIKEVIVARRQLAVSIQTQAMAPGDSSTALVTASRQRLAVAEQEAALAKKLSSDATQHLRAVETANARMATSFLRLGNALKYAFMGGLAFGILSFFQQLPAAIMKATEAAVDFSKVQLALAVGLREMRRRSGEAPMFAEITAEIEDMTNRFGGLYSQMDFSESYATTIAKLGRLGASFEDVNKVVETSAVLAQLNEKSLKDTTSALATYLNSGVSQGLEATGIIVGRAADKFVAFEEGLKKATLDGIDPATKALMRLQFVAKQIDPQLAELASRPQIIANTWDAANNSVTESTITLGKAFAPFVIMFKQGWADILQVLANDVIPVLQDVFVWIVEYIGKRAAQTFYILGSIYEQMQRIKEGSTDLITPEEFFAGFEEASKTGAKVASEHVKNYFIDDTQKALEDWADQPQDFMGAIIPEEAEADELKDFWADLFQEINKLIRDYNRDIVEAEEDYKKELLDIDKEYAKKRLEIEIAFRQKLEDLARKNQQDIQDEYRKYQQSIEDVNREYAQKIQDANSEFRDNEIEAEAEFQKKLKRLREDFLFDLEDAVRERDARQIMSLIRRYNMQRERLIEDFQDEKSEREKNQRDQLEEIRIWRQRRLEELAIEHARRLEEIAIQYQREREEAARNREQDLAETEEWREEQRAAALEAYNQELEDLKQHFADRMTEILTSLMEEKDIQEKYAKAIADLIKKTFGKGGKIENDFKNFNKVVDESVAKAIEAIAAIEALEASLQIPETPADPSVPATEPETPEGETSEDRSLPDRQLDPRNGKGGVSEFGSMSDVINTNIVPSSSLVGSSPTMSSEQPGSAKIQIFLSEGLEARITEQTMNELIDVISQVRQ